MRGPPSRHNPSRDSPKEVRVAFSISDASSRLPSSYSCVRPPQPVGIPRKKAQAASSCLTHSPVCPLPILPSEVHAAASSAALSIAGARAALDRGHRRKKTLGSPAPGDDDDDERATARRISPERGAVLSQVA